MTGHFSKRHAYIDLESLINVMSRRIYNWIMTYGLESKVKPSNPNKISNFVGRVISLKIFIGSFTYEHDFMILEDTTSITDRHLGEMAFESPFIDETGLVYNKEKGTVMFKQNDKKITFKMPHTMEVFKRTRLMGLSTDSIPPSAYEENFSHRRTYYYQSLLIGDEYRQDEGDRRGIRHLMRLEKEMMDDEGEVTGNRKLKPGALSLYMGNGQRTTIEAIGSYDLCFPSGLVMARKPFSHQVERAKDLLGLIHIDVCDPFRIVSRQEASYFVTFTNDYSRYGYVYLLKHKHEVFETFKVFQTEVENQLGKTIKSLRYDRGVEYMRIIAHRTPPYTSQHNGVSERRNRTLLDMVHSMMSQTTLQKSFWDYALESATRILNMVPTKKVKKTPYEVWHGQALKMSYLKDDPITQEACGSLKDLEIIQEQDTHPSKNTSIHHDEGNQEIDEPQSDIIPIRRSTRTRHAPDRMYPSYIDDGEYELGDINEPGNYKAALLDPKSDKWLEVMNVEMQFMKDNEVWDLVDIPLDGKTVSSKWLFKKKTGMDGAVHTYKARLVVKGFTQTYGVDYEETFSPVADIRSIRILIAIVAFYDYEIWQMDVKTAFLNEHLFEEVYMVQPEGFVNPKYPNRLRVSCYTDAGYLTDADDLKSQTGYVFILNGGVVDRKSTKQSIFTTSFAEAENIATLDASKEAVWVRKLISGLSVVPIIEEPIKMYYDNTGAITIANESGITKGARHYQATVHYLREL
ncbi:retrotransposon protein, putative, ty1-copia subclass [Tanacetum coccineum]